jgi:tetratricopeptide (TPR) repeat protein
MEEYNETIILKKAKEIKQSQLPNLKAHLYKQLLTSLRLTQINHDISISIREQIDHAKVLYNKGLYQQSLRILDKTKALARKNKKNILVYEIIQFEKLIESQYVTKSIENRAEEITREATEISKTMDGVVYFSNMSIRLYGLYLKVGYVRNEKDLLMVKEFFNTNLIRHDIEKLSFFEKLYLFQSYVWYYLIIQDFLMCYKYAKKWVDLFLLNPEMINIHMDLYLKGLNNVLVALFYTNHVSNFKKHLRLLRKLEGEDQFKHNSNLNILLHMFLFVHRINRHFMEGTFDKGLHLIPKIESFLENNKVGMDNHRALIFYYKIACLYFGNGQYREAVKYLNRISDVRDTSLRGDIHCFGRILNLISHYELENTELLEYQIRSTYRFLAKMEDLQEVQKYILRFLRKLSSISPDQLKDELKKSRKDLQKWINDPYEKRAFLYLDLISWLDAKIENRPIQDVIMEKINKNKR